MIPIKADRFVWSGLEERARAENLDLEQLVAQACVYYLSELGGERAATRLPRFAADEERGQTRTLTLELDDARIARLNEEAGRQGVTLERLLRHAAVLYLADYDAGRVAKRVAKRAQASDDTEPA